MFLCRFLFFLSTFVCASTLFFSLPAAALAPAVHHPLDALTPAEYWVVYKTIRDAGHTEEKTLFSSVLLHEPDKKYVLAWKPGDPIERKADAVLYYKGKSYAALVNISTAKVESFEELKGMQAPYTTTEEQEVNDAIKHDARIVDALKKRGITDLNLVTCYATPGGYIGSAGAGRTQDRMGRLRIQHRRGEWIGRPRSGRNIFYRRYGRRRK